MDEDSKNARRHICNHIGLLASVSLQLKYEVDVPIADVPWELIEMFTDSYHPRWRPFVEAFNEAELKDLAAPDKLLDLASRKLRKTKGLRVADLQKLPEWKRVMAYAQELETKIIPVG